MSGRKKVSKKAEKRRDKEELAKKASLELFSNYYRPQYGIERWSELLASLQQPVQHCAFVNKYADQQFAKKLIGISTGQTIPFLSDFISNAYVHFHHDDLASIQVELDAEGEAIIEELDVPESVDSLCDGARWPRPGIPSSLDPQGLCCYYPMDAASLLPVMVLNIQPSSRVFDMCAAPGGKSIAIASYLTNSPDSTTMTQGMWS